MSKRDFEKILLEAVDEGLSSLGQSPRRAIYFHLKKSFNVKKQEIPFKIEFFADAIEKIFGWGANSLEIVIMKRLHKKTEEAFELHESTDLAFTEYVSTAKRAFLEKKRAKKIAKKLVQCEELMIKR